MTMITLVCPKCGGQAKLSLVDTSYVGPRRCWKCHEYFTITINNSRVTSCEPLSEEEFERQQEAKKAAEKAQGGISFSKREEPEFRRVAPEKQPEAKKTPEKTQSGISFSKREEPEIRQLSLDIQQEAKKAPEKAQSGISFSKQAEPEIRQVTPEKRQDFIKPSFPKEPLSQTEPGKPASTFPPDRIQTFIPMENIGKEPEKPKKSKKPSSQPEPGNPASTFPPDRFQTFIPIEDTDKE